MPEERLIFNIKNEIRGIASVLITIVLLSIPVFLFLLPVPVGGQVFPPTVIMQVAAVSAAMGALAKGISLIIRDKSPYRKCNIKTAGYFLSLSMFLRNTIFTLILYALFYKIFPYLIMIFSKAGLTGLPGIVTVIGLPAALIGFAADKLIRGLAKKVARVLS